MMNPRQCQLDCHDSRVQTYKTWRRAYRCRVHACDFCHVTSGARNQMMPYVRRFFITSKHLVSSRPVVIIVSEVRIVMLLALCLQDVCGEFSRRYLNPIMLGAVIPVKLPPKPPSQNNNTSPSTENTGNNFIDSENTAHLVPNTVSFKELNTSEDSIHQNHFRHSQRTYSECGGYEMPVGFSEKIWADKHQTGPHSTTIHNHSSMKGVDDDSELVRIPHSHMAPVSLTSF